MASEHSASPAPVSQNVSENVSESGSSLPYSPNYPITPKPFRPNLEMYQASVNSTPPNQGSADHVATDEQHQRVHVEPFLKHDLKHDKLVDVDEFIRHALQLRNLSEREEQVLTSIVTSKEFTAHIDNYCKEVQREEKRYPLFVAMFNYAIKRMVDEGITENALGLIAHYNDRAISGSKGERKPDIGLLMERIAVYGRLGIDPAKNMNAAERKEVEKKVALAVSKAPKDRFAWGDLLSFAEFKLLKKSIKKAEKKAEPEASNASSKKATSSKSTQATSAKSSTMVAGSSKTPVLAKPKPKKLILTKGMHGTVELMQANDFPYSTGKLPAVLVHKKALTKTHMSVSSSGKSSGSKRERSDSSSDDSQRPPAKRPAIQDDNPLPDGALQCAGYALEMFNHGSVHTHVIGTLFHDDKMRLLLYTRSRSCRTKPFSFINNPFKFLVIIFALSKLSLPQWGVLDLITPRYLVEFRKRSLRVADYGLLKTKGTRYLKLGEHVFHVLEVLVFPRGLIGRGTWTILLQRIDGTRWVLKLACQAESREPEWKFLDTVHDFVAEKPEERKWILNHLPKMLLKQDIALDVVDFEALLGSNGDPKDFGYEPRVMRAIVYEQLYPIHTLHLPGLFKKVFLDTIECHEWLTKHLHILHRDISVGNLMYRISDDNQVYGVLNDFDLARFVDKQDPKPSSKHRTGTKPFVAIDLLDTAGDIICHHVRHDLESFFYVFVWIVTRFHEGEEIDNAPFMEWATGTWGEVSLKKNAFLKPKSKISVTETYAPLQELVDEWKKMWFEAVNVKDQVDGKIASAEVLATYDEETLGGRITYEKIRDLFNKYPLDLEDVVLAEDVPTEVMEDANDDGSDDGEADVESEDE
ncbi:hypothetical protein VNI00_003028 [Paramarasmius palmivorus]|uniref:Fungal-type protein kinase domain-containing protein n=1 Tax=Paramarasmius palmivorus TaxID=297713 RepID=A0AAW0DYZ0_9AGAR